MDQNRWNKVYFPSFMRKIMYAVGFVMEPPYGLTIRGKLFLLSSMCFIVQTVYSLVIKWDNMPLRFLTIRHLTVETVITSAFTEYTLRPHHIHDLLRISEEEYFNYQMARPEETIDVIKKTSAQMNFGSTMLLRFMGTEFIAITIVPLIYIIYMTVVSHYNLWDIPPDVFKPENLPLPMIFGSKIPNLTVYIMIYVWQAVYLLGGHLFSYGFNTACAYTAKRTAGDIKLFNTMMNHYDKVLSGAEGNGDKKNGVQVDNNYMRNAFRELVNHHDYIYRKCKLLNALTGATFNLINDVLMFLICLDVYEFAKSKKTQSKLRCVLQSAPVIGILFLHSSKGQDLINAGDEMFDTITRFSWVDKPKWCKDTITMMLVRNKSRTEVKPFGLYVLDLSNFAVVLNCAYSYFNVFSRFEQG